MDEFSLTINISAPPRAVFAFLANPPNMTRWYDAVEEVSLGSAHHIAEGSTFQIVRSLPGGRAVNDVEITEYETDRRLTIESRGGPTPFRYTYTLEAAGEDTELTLDGQISSRGLPGPIEHLGPLAGRLFARGMSRNLRTLKHLLEVEVPPHTQQP